jgi:2-polyprenyl-3-methyl-5-hydroxy-6-metoxy-1,4-benzoquinol methylase
MIEYIQRQCPVCSNTRPEFMHFIEQVGEVNRILCKSCDTIYFDRTPPAQPVYDLKYNLHFFRPGDIRKAGIMAARLGELAALRFEKPNILEAGAGNGLTVLLLRAQGFNAFGVDLDRSLAAYLKEKFNIPIVCARFEEFKAPGKYHLIYSSHLIEHIPYPAKFMQRAWDLLEDGGILFLDTPDTFYYDKSKERWHHFATRDPFEHCCLLGFVGIRFMANNLGFDILSNTRFDEFQSQQIILRKPGEAQKCPK